MLAAAFPSLAIAHAATAAEALPHAGAATAIFALAQAIDDPLLAAAERLDWVQALTTGVDPLLDRPALPARVLVTSARGIHGPQMSEMAFMHMLALTRGLPRMLANQRRAVWERWPQPLLESKVATVVGVGEIAHALARRCNAFGMRVLGVSARERSAEGFERVFPRSSLTEAVGQADYVVVLTPLTPATTGLIDAHALAAMRPEAFLVNLARGGVVDEGALIEALRARTIAGAGLDVFAAEPLPPESPLWALDNVLITPHVGGMSDVYAEQVIDLLRANVAAYLAGTPEAMRNIVPRVAGA